MRTRSILQSFFLILSFSILFISCSRKKDNKVFIGHQKGVWKSTDTSQILNLIFQDSAKTVIVTPNIVIGSPEFYGKKNKSGIRSFFNFKKDPIELNQVYYNNEGKTIDTIKYFIQFIGKDTLQMTKNKGRRDNKDYFINKKDTIYTFIRTDSISMIPKTINDITSTIYKLYSNFSYNMSAMNEGFDAEKIPVYGNFLEISLGMSMIRMLTMKYSFDAENICIIQLNDKEAKVSYTLNIIESDKLKKQKIIVTKLRKINNEWRVYWKDIFGTGTL